MSYPTSNPKSQRLLDNVKTIFSKKPIFRELEPNIIFVCGGSIQENSFREGFLNYAKNELETFRIFLAEDAAQDFIDFDKPQFLELADFEKLIAEIADTIIIFPESPGSFAEIGFFSNSIKEITKRILVVNNIKEQSNSFLNLGPIHKIEKVSDYGKALHLEPYPSTSNFPQIKDRLEKFFPRKRRIKINFNSFAKIKPSEKLFYIYELVSIFRILSFEGLKSAIRNIFGKPKEKELKILLSLLVSTGDLIRIDGEEQLFITSKNSNSFINIENLDKNRLILLATEALELSHPKFHKLVIQNQL